MVLLSLKPAGELAGHCCEGFKEVDVDCNGFVHPRQLIFPSIWEQLNIAGIKLTNRAR